MVTPLRFRAVTSSPSGKCRSIFFTGGVVSSFLRISLSSTVEGDVLIFLRRGCQITECVRNVFGSELNLPPRGLCFLCELQLNSLGLCGGDNG